MAVTYTVQSGDTLAKIAARFNTTVERLVELNNLSNPNSINVGQVLVVDDQSGGVTPGETAGGSTAGGVDPYATRVIDGLLYIFGTPRAAYRQGEPIPLFLIKTNISGRTLRLFYPTAQRFEFEAVNVNGRVIWNYSAGRVFAQVTETVVLEPGESQTFRFTWDQRNNQGNQVQPQTLTFRGYNVAQGYRNQAVTLSNIRITGGVAPTTPVPTTPVPTTPAPQPCQAGVNLVRNAGFERWTSEIEPVNWAATNVIRLNRPHTGTYAAGMGREPGQSAELFQDVSVIPGRVYRLAFWGREIGDRNRGSFSLRTSVVYFDQGGNVIGQSDPDYDEDSIPNDRYNQFSFTTGRIPAAARTARVRFRFTPRRNNQNRVAIDDVFFECIL